VVEGPADSQLLQHGYAMIEHRKEERLAKRLEEEAEEARKKQEEEEQSKKARRKGKTRSGRVVTRRKHSDE
jgi:hypothetical protein